jgi:hypothetical protein
MPECRFGHPGKRLEMQSKAASLLLLVVLLGAAAGGNAAQPGGDNAFTLYAGYRDGGRFTDVTTGSRLPIEASGVGAVSLDFALNPKAGTQLQVYLSRQQSRVDALSLGIGYQLPLGERVALRFEARGYATLVNSSSALFCSGGCVLSIKGDTVTQGDLLVGLAYTY